MKHISKIAAVFVALVLALAFVGCAAPDALTGKTYEASLNGSTMTISFELGGKCTVSAGGQSVSNTYSVAGNMGVIMYQGGSNSIQTTDNWETFTMDGMTFRRK